MSKKQEFLSVVEAAILAQVSQKTIRNWLESGDITRYKAANKIQINKAELLAFITPKVDK